MVPTQITRHLQDSGIPFTVRPHARAVTAQELAASVHVTGYRVAKSVLLEADGQRLIAVLPAADVVDLPRLATAVGALSMRVMDEAEFYNLFSDCEVGAEPPFGSLYGLPVVIDRRLAVAGPMILRAGSHQDAIEMSYEDFARLENPRVADFALLDQAPSRHTEDERWVTT